MSRPISIDREVAIVNAQIDILQRREDEYRRLLEDVKRLCDSVREEKAALERKRRDLELDRHPINWLPFELLLRIFIAIVEDEDENLSLRKEMDSLYHRPPVILSHVCHKWREATLSTSCLWSRIVCTSVQHDTLTPLRTFLKRACNSPLDIVYAPSNKTVTLSHESRQISRFVSLLTPHISRSRSILFGCHGVESIKLIIDILKSSTHKFPCLESLELSIVSYRPWFTSAPSPVLEPLEKHFTTVKSSTAVTSYCPLKHLRLEQVPIFNVPILFLPNLTSLELCFPQDMAISRYHYKLTVSAFCLFLSLVPGLTTLVLCDTVPFFDIIFNPDDSSDSHDQNSVYRRKPVELLYLKRFDWTFPFPTDVHRFLMFLSAPSLERFDLCLDNMPSKRGDTRLLRGYDDTLSELNSGASSRVLRFNALKELSIHCTNEDAIGSVLRKLSFPVLQKVEISSVDVPSQNAPKRILTGMPKLLRLESIFRDPRLPHVTQFTLSHFEISPEHGRSMLGYMPALISLKLDSCTGVGRLIDGLKDGLTTIMILHEGKRKRVVRFCPRLEGLILLGCMDVDFAAVRDLVEARNVGLTEGCEGIGESTQAAHVTVPTVRKIKPLRRTRRHQASDTIEPTAPIGNPLSAPRRINYVRIKDCPMIEEGEALSLQDLGVAVVQWG